jgi:uroporphyrinogen decarboxylase
MSPVPRERFIAALERRPPVGRVPHFELVFFLTMEAFGRVHPSHRDYGQWLQMEERERELHRHDMADLYLATAARYEHDAIFLHPNPNTPAELARQVEIIREKSGDRYFLLAHGDATYAVPDGTHMEDFACRMVEDPAGLKAEAAAKVRAALDTAAGLRRPGGLDGFALCADYCFNTGPFLSPARFGEFVTPFLAELTRGYRDLGYYVIKHTDGNIMPILDQLVQTGPHALHSLDPQGGVDLAEIKRRHGHELCLMGNVHCGLMDNGTPAEIAADARRALREGMPGGGYVFCTSNCIYTGMPLASYETMLEVWRAEGNY